MNEKTELDEKRKYLAILDPIQKEILTEWSSIDPEEQAGIKDLFVNWQINIEKISIVYVLQINQFRVWI